MKKHVACTLLALLCTTGPLPAATSAHDLPASVATGLEHSALTRVAVPIPAAERGLQTALAAPWFCVSQESHVLEGAAVDAGGTLHFCEVSTQDVLALSADRQLRTVLHLDDMAPTGLAFDRDGRLFVAAMNQDKGYGAILSLDPADPAKGVETVLDRSAGYMPNDLVLDGTGGFYFTDFRGTYDKPVGGVYHVAADRRSITPLLSGLVQANGLALSPDGTVLWVTEFGRNLLHRIELADATTRVRTGTSIPYHFQGPAPDSMRTDSEGNVYVALYTQGRVLVLASAGIPIGQILLPGRDQGDHLLSTSLAIDPASRKLFIVSGNATGEKGAHIFASQAFARGFMPGSR